MSNQLYKADKALKTKFNAISKKVTELMEQKNSVMEEMDKALMDYKPKFEELYVGKYFMQKEKARDCEIQYYIIPLSVSEPYTIDSNRWITCALKCATFRVQKSVYEGETHTVITFSSSDGYYAHTDMEPITSVTPCST